MIQRAWRIYRRADWQQAADFAAKHHTMWTTVRFLGVWDTVAALGVPLAWLDVIVDRIPLFRHTFHRFDLSQVVEHGRHALAIDDLRRTFHPELWPTGKPGTATRTMKQVWFAGSHSDIGGGYRDARLSDITLQWMVYEAVCLGSAEGSACLRIQPGNGARLAPNAQGKLHDSRARGLGRLYRRQARSWPQGWGEPTIHQSVFDRAAWSRDLGVGPVYRPWLLRQVADRYRVEPWSQQPAARDRAA